MSRTHVDLTVEATASPSLPEQLTQGTHRASQEGSATKAARQTSSTTSSETGNDSRLLHQGPEPASQTIVGTSSRLVKPRMPLVLNDAVIGRGRRANFGSSVYLTTGWVRWAAATVLMAFAMSA